MKLSSSISLTSVKYILSCLKVSQGENLIQKARVEDCQTKISENPYKKFKILQTIQINLRSIKFSFFK